MSNEFPPPPGNYPYQQGVPQQPLPYGTYNPYLQPQAPTSTACRTTAIVQIILGSLMTLLSFCLFAGGVMAKSGAIPMNEPEFAGIADVLHIVLLVMGGCFIVAGLAYVILGIFIWRMSKVAVIVSLVLCSIMLLLNLGGMAVTLAPGQFDLNSLASNSFGTLILASLVGLQIWSLKDLSRLSRDAATVQMQWQQYYQGQNPQYPQYPQEQQQQPPQTPPFPPQPPQTPTA